MEVYGRRERVQCMVGAVDLDRQSDKLIKAAGI